MFGGRKNGEKVKENEKKNTSSTRTQSGAAKKKLQGGCHGSNTMLIVEIHGRAEKKGRTK